MFKKIIICLALFLFDNQSRAQADLFEKSFQDDWLQTNRKFLKTANGFSVYFSYRGFVNGPFLKKNKIYRLNNLGEIQSITNIPNFVQYSEENFIDDWYETDSGGLMIASNSNGCDYFLENSLSVSTISNDGILQNTKFFNEGGYDRGLIKFRDGFIHYYNTYNQSIKWEYLSQNLESIPFIELYNKNYIKLFTIVSDSVYAIKRLNNNTIKLIQLDTLGNENLQSSPITVDYSYILSNNFSSIKVRDKIYIGFNNYLITCDSNLQVLDFRNKQDMINQLSQDSVGNVYILSGNKILEKIDENYNIISSIDLKLLAPKIFKVEWFNINHQDNKIYYGGMISDNPSLYNSYPFLKSIKLDDYEQSSNNLAIKIQKVEITNSEATLFQSNTLQYFINYKFFVRAKIVNTGATIIDSLFLNCSNQIGGYICGGPYLSKKFINLNLNPGDSILLNIGNYIDQGISAAPILIDTYTRSNFCVWPSYHNGSWSYSVNEQNCSDVNITNVILGIENNLIENQEFSIYPNPTSDKIFIDMKDYIGEIHLKIIDMNGNVLIKQTNNSEINVSELMSGIYFLEISTKSKVLRKKVFKQ